MLQLITYKIKAYLAFMNKTAATNAVTIPSAMIAMATPVTTYIMEPDPLSVLASLLVRIDTDPMVFAALVTSTDTETSGGIEMIPSSEETGDLEMTPSLEASGGIEVTASSVTSVDIDVTSSSASDEASTVGIMVVLPTRFIASDELVQVVSSKND